MQGRERDRSHPRGLSSLEKIRRDGRFLSAARLQLIPDFDAFQGSVIFWFFIDATDVSPPANCVIAGEARA